MLLTVKFLIPINDFKEIFWHIVEPFVSGDEGGAGYRREFEHPIVNARERECRHRIREFCGPIKHGDSL